MVLDEALSAMEVLLRILSTKVLSGHSFMVRFLLNSVRRCKSICRAYFQQIAAQIGLWTVRLTSLRHVLRVEILVEALIVSRVDQSVVYEFALRGADVYDAAII